MINMIIDFVRIPTDDYGNLLYNVDEVKQILESYQKIFPDHQVFAMPDKIKVWENLDIEILEYMIQYLKKIIQEKKQTNDRIYNKILA